MMCVCVYGACSLSRLHKLTEGVRIMEGSLNKEPQGQLLHARQE